MTEFEQWIRNISRNGKWNLEENYQTVLQQANLLRRNSNLPDAHLVEAISIIIQTAQAEVQVDRSAP